VSEDESLERITKEGIEMVYLPHEPKMKPTDPNKINWGRTILISLSFFTVLLAWGYFNFKVPLLLDNIIPDNPFKDLIKGSILAIDNLVAVILQPYFGDLSDHTKSKFGRRMPFIIIGTTASAVFFIMIPWMQVLAALVLIIFLFDLAMSIYRSASIAILPDYTSERMYSKGSAIQQFIANLGGLLGFIIPIIVGAIPGLTGIWFDALGFIIVAILMILLVIIQVLLVRETPTGDKFFKITKNKLELETETFRALESVDPPIETASEKQKFGAYRRAVGIVRTHKDFALFIGTVFFIYLAFASVEAFFSSFAVEFIGISEGLAATLFIAYSGPMIATAYIVGLLGQSKRIGRKKAVIIYLVWLLGSVCVMAFIVVPFVYQNAMLIILFIMLALTSIPWMGFIVNSFPILWSLAPEAKTGIYTGVYYTFNQLAYTLAPVFFGGLLSVFGFWGSFRYIIMFPFILICIIIAMLFFIRIKGGEASK